MTTESKQVDERQLSTQPRHHSITRYVLILGGLGAFGPLSIDMYLPAFPLMSEDLHATNSSLQLTLTTFIIGMVVGQVIAGPLTDAWGRRRPLIIGLAIYIVASLLCAVSPSIEMLITCRALQAVGAATGMVVSRAIARDLFSGTALTKFFSVLMLVTGLGPILAPVIGGQILRFTTWHGVFVALTIFGTLILLTVATALPESLPISSRRPARLVSTLKVYGSLFADRVFVGFAMTSGLIFASMFGYISASSFVLQEIHGLSAQEYSAVFGANGVGLMITSQINGRIVGRFPERALLRAGLLLAVAAGVLILLSTFLNLGLAGILISLLMLVSSIGLVTPNAASLALANHADKAGTASAVLGLLQLVFGAAAAPVVGLGDKTSELPMALVIAIGVFLAFLSFATLTRPNEKLTGSL